MYARIFIPSAFVILIILAGPSFGFVSESLCIYGGDFNLSIPAEPGNSKGWMADAIVDVPDEHIIFDLDVVISLMHSNVFDLQIFLQGPNGQRICLNMYDSFDKFFVGEDYRQTIFDDEAQIAIEHGQVPFVGRFRPMAGNELSVFDGQYSQGLWRLQIYDAFYFDTGTLDSFELMITNPEPATAVLFVLGSALMLTFRPSYKG